MLVDNKMLLNFIHKIHLDPARYRITTQTNTCLTLRLSHSDVKHQLLFEGTFYHRLLIIVSMQYLMNNKYEYFLRFIFNKCN